MTIRLDDALLREVGTLAEERGVVLDAMAAELLRTGLARTAPDRWAVSRTLLSVGRSRSPVSSVDLLDQIRDEGR